MANLETVSDASVANQSYAATENWAEAPKTNNLSDLAQELMSSHAHRPGLVQEDLAKATEALHANGSLANLSIIGLDGKDLIARDEQGQTLLLDVSNPENQQVLPTNIVSQPIGANGRTAELAADGSGKYTVVSGDSCWRIANDILTSQGVEQPTDNQIANYIKELETSNGRSFAQLQVGDEINIPTKIQGGVSSSFADPEKAVPTDITVPTETIIPAETSVPELSPEAAKQMELEKFGIDTNYALMGQGLNRATEHFTPRGTYSKPSATLYDINSTLNRSDLTANEKLGLKMMQSQYDYLKSSEDGNIHLSDLDRGKAQRYQEIEAKYSPSTAEASPAVNLVFNPYAGIFPEVTVTAPTPAALPN
ncbi:LysM peptidoglycan-binding domain-containing protein [bacterium]|nr:LysM peptidoglycan-binding domain-containing protein [bacterium]MBP9807174.1 LysM peptidoglycan-binding domain-containing protein [bacterium]